MNFFSDGSCIAAEAVGTKKTLHVTVIGDMQYFSYSLPAERVNPGKQFFEIIVAAVRKSPRQCEVRINAVVF